MLTQNGDQGTAIGSASNTKIPQSSFGVNSDAQNRPLVLKTSYLQNNIFEGTIVYNKNNEDPAHFILRLKSLNKALSNDDHTTSSNISVSKTNEIVNGKNSFSLAEHFCTAFLFCRNTITNTQPSPVLLNGGYNKNRSWRHGKYEHCSKATLPSPVTSFQI